MFDHTLICPFPMIGTHLISAGTLCGTTYCNQNVQYIPWSNQKQPIHKMFFGVDGKKLFLTVRRIPISGNVCYWVCSDCKEQLPHLRRNLIGIKISPIVRNGLAWIFFLSLGPSFICWLLPCCICINPQNNQHSSLSLLLGRTRFYMKT